MVGEKWQSRSGQAQGNSEARAICSEVTGKHGQLADLAEPIQSGHPPSIQDPNERVERTTGEESFIMEGRPKISIIQKVGLVEFEVLNLNLLPWKAKSV